MAELLRSDVPNQVSGRVRMAVRVTVETHDAAAGPLRTAILRLIELLLRKWRDEQAQSLELLRIQQAIEELIEIVDRDQLPLRYVAKIGSRREKNRRRKLRQQVIRQIEVEIESREVTLFLFLDLVD